VLFLLIFFINLQLIQIIIYEGILYKGASLAINSPNLLSLYFAVLSIT
jgi:hypothetical protein